MSQKIFSKLFFRKFQNKSKKVALTSFRYTPKLFTFARKHSGSSSLGLNNSRYDPRKWHVFKPSQAYISKNSFSSGQNRFCKNFLRACVGVLWGGNEVFRDRRTLRTRSGVISEPYETFWRIRKFSSFFTFSNWKVKGFGKDLVQNEPKKIFKTFFSKISK